MKKYIPVFGPQELFDGAENCDEYFVAVQHSVGQKTKVSFYPSLVEAFNYVTDFPPRGVVFHRAAMRRIEEMQEPKRWTWEDKKAGRLPEVGAEVIRVDHEDEGCNVTGVVIATWRCIENNTLSQVCLKLKDGSLFLVDLYEELKPIETPEEKASRLKDEWCKSAAKQLKNLEYISALTSIYDAMLSGELPPVQAKDGA